ncbi:MAG TPA: hypothetical protein VGM56_25610 [Byssovorax sp.]|jgi:uncharacterized protein (DUF697 family)
MASDPPASATAADPVEASASAPPTGKLAVMTAYAVAAAALPIPFLPDRLIRRVRGAIVHDVGARHGLSFTEDAREALASASTNQRQMLIRAAETVARQLVKRFIAPIGVFSYVANGAEVFALGLLLERYLARMRPPGSVRVDAEEARAVRLAIDKAIVRAASPQLRPQLTTLAKLPDDQRTESTRWIDAALLTSATLPSWIERRLEAAFDEIIAETPGLGRA